MCPGTHISWTLLCSTSFTWDWSQFQTSLRFIWKLLRALIFLPGIPWCAAQDRIYGLYWVPFIHSSTNTICFGTISIPDKASLIIWVKSILQFILVRKLNLEWLIISIYTFNKMRGVYDYIILCHIYWSYAYLGIILSVPISMKGSCYMSQDFLVWPQLVDLGFHWWLHISL